MGAAAALGAAASAASIASSISNFNSGSGGTPGVNSFGGVPLGYQPQAQPQADWQYQMLSNQLFPFAQNLPGQVIPQYQQLSANITNNPYANMAQTGANATGAADLGAAGGLYGAGTQLLNLGFDPRQQLYDRTVQQLQDQLHASNAMSGIAGPAAAGVNDQALANFNIDWQNQQLNRGLAGASGAGGAFSGANQLGQAGAALPYQTYLGQQKDSLAGLQALSQGTNAAFAPADTLQHWLQSYLQLGQSATGLAQAGQQQGFNQQQILGGQFGNALQSLAGNTGLTSGLDSLLGLGGGGGGNPLTDFQLQNLGSFSSGGIGAIGDVPPGF